MGENDIKLGSGQLYFIEPDGSTSLVGDETDASVECSTLDNDISAWLANPACFEVTIELPPRAAKRLDWFITMTGINNYCPDRRVVHLAMYGKTARIRKKNFNRAIKILEDLNED